LRDTLNAADQRMHTPIGKTGMSPFQAIFASRGSRQCGHRQRLVEGVVDLVFLEDRPEIAGWTVVDFKTDREFATSSDRYTAQASIEAGRSQV
jgi:ATP-dependent exoDNAse (exonuclease V) beta subunit